MEVRASDLLRTTDFALSASLLTLGYKLELLDRTRSDGRVEFAFRTENGINETIQQHFSGQLRLPTIDYYSATRNLKSRLRNEHDL